ncbi:MAG: hypothetical protein JO023_23655 [Chloroflexi bacterium]|nr:hypothetical protein [Chloroflexota bacterium]
MVVLRCEDESPPVADRLRVAQLFVRHGATNYSDAVASLDAIFGAQLPGVERQLIVIDNSLAEDYERPLGRGRVLIGGSNAQWEFSAWARGIEYLGRAIEDYDLVLLGTSAFKSSDSDYLALLNEEMLAFMRDRAVAMGRINHYPDPIVVLGGASQGWIRSSFILLAPRELERLGSVISVWDGSRFFSGNAARPFLVDAPLSANYQDYILAWLTGDGLWDGLIWHSRFRLTDETLGLFEAKALAILNEHLLSMRLGAQGCAMVDVSWLALRQSQVAPGEPVGPIPSWRSQIAERATYFG